MVIFSLMVLNIQAYGFIPLQAKRVGEFIEISHKKISPTRILSTLGCLSLCNSCHSVTLRPINLSKLAPFAWGSWNLPHKFHLYLIYLAFLFRSSGPVSIYKCTDFARIDWAVDISKIAKRRNGIKYTRHSFLSIQFFNVFCRSLPPPTELTFSIPLSFVRVVSIERSNFPARQKRLELESCRFTHERWTSARTSTLMNWPG